MKAGGRRRTDSTHVLGRIRGLNRLELAGETVRAALEALAAAPGWLAGVIGASWQQVYGQRIGNFRLPASETARRGLAAQYGRDGYLLLGQVVAPGWLPELPAVAALRRVWVQQYYCDIGEGGEKAIWRDPGEHGLPPGSLRIVSPYDLDARASVKRGTVWVGYKVHLSETCSGQPSLAHCQAAAASGMASASCPSTLRPRPDDHLRNVPPIIFQTSAARRVQLARRPLGRRVPHQRC